VLCVLGMGDEFRCRIPSSTLPNKPKSREMAGNRGRRGEDDDRRQDAHKGKQASVPDAQFRLESVQRRANKNGREMGRRICHSGA
jgi:hypothetical protein